MAQTICFRCGDSAKEHGVFKLLERSLDSQKIRVCEPCAEILDRKDEARRKQLYAAAMAAQDLDRAIVEHAATVLRGVADGKSFDAFYFRSVTMAVEALRDEQWGNAFMFLGQAEKFKASATPPGAQS